MGDGELTTEQIAAYEGIFTTAMAARALGVSDAAIRRAIDRGTLKAVLGVRPGTHRKPAYHIQAADLAAWDRQRKTPSYQKIGRHRSEGNV